MEYRYLGQTGISVSRLCFGSLTLGPLQAHLKINEGAALLRYAFEQGINFIDTAQLYQTYPYIKKALKGWDKKVVIATKSYDYTWEGMKKSVEEARLALDRDYLDIFLLHEQESALTLKGHQPALDYLLEAKSRGIIRAIGVSTHTVEVIKVATSNDNLEVIHPIVNYQGLGLLDGTLADLLPALKDAYEAGKGIYGMKPLGGGNLIKDVQKALEFVFELPYLHSVAAGCKMEEELIYNLSILEGITPPKKIVDKLNSTSRRLHIESWCQGCGTCVLRCPYGSLVLHERKVIWDETNCVLCGYCGAVCPHFAIKVI